MAYTFRIEATGTDEDVTQTYYVQIREESTGDYYDTDSSSFVPFGSLVDGNLPMTEAPPASGCWELNVDLGVSTGLYTLLPRDGLTDLLLPDKSKRVYLVGGSNAVDDARARVLLTANYGGVDALRLLTDRGDPVEGATVMVFTKADYDADMIDRPVGVTTTRVDGRWTDAVPVNAGITYTILYHKAYSIGPVSTEVVVP
jgi:hypothetical protein